MPAGYTTLRLACGHVHVLCTQSKTDECGEACAGMVIATKKSRYVDLATLRTVSQSHGGLYYRPGAKDAGAPVGDSRYAAMATLLRKGAAPDVGTGLGNLVEVLQEYGVTSVEHRGGAALKVKAAAKAGQMAIAQVEWGGGGSHFIVVHGQAGDKYCILDPGSNTLVQTEAVGSTTYTAPYGLTGLYIACAVVS